MNFTQIIPNVVDIGFSVLNITTKNKGVPCLVPHLLQVDLTQFQLEQYMGFSGKAGALLQSNYATFLGNH